MSTLDLSDSKRASGRTTRMILAAGAHLLKHPDSTVILVAHNRNAMLNIEHRVKEVLSATLARRVYYDYYRNAKIVLDLNTPRIFIDHHCYFDEYTAAKQALHDVTLKLEVWDEH